MKQTKGNKVRRFLARQLQFSVYEIALSGIFVALWIVSALPVFNFNFGFMRIGVTYVWPIVLGLTIKPFVALICTIIGDNLALLASGTGFGQWMIEYAIIAPAIVLIVAICKKLIDTKNEKRWWLMVASVNGLILIGTLVTMVAKSSFSNQSSNAESFFDFSHGVAKIIVWTMYALIMLFSMALAVFYVLGQKGRALKVRVNTFSYDKNAIGKIRFNSKVKTFKINSAFLRQILSFYTLIMLIIVITIWIWGPFAQLRYLNLYVKTSAYSDYDLFLIPRILKTPVSLALYTAFVIPIYKTHELSLKRITHENKW